MPVARLSISFDVNLARRVKRAAGSEPTSSWLADAARRKLRAEGLLAVIHEWESIHGAITEADLRAVGRRQRRRRRQGPRSE